jgi:hypothetical protein
MGASQTWWYPMSQIPVSPIRNSGGAPPQRHLKDQSRYDEERMLLFAAWAHGMAIEDIVHRYTVFAFVQTHLACKSEQQMQRTIESSSNWKAHGGGNYQLREQGMTQISRQFGPRPPKSSLTSTYILTRTVHGRKFAVEIPPISHALVVSLDRIQVSGVDACRTLENLGESFITKSTSRPSRVWNWLVQMGPFEWERNGG